MDKRTLLALAATVAGIAGMCPSLMVGQSLSIGVIGGGSLTDAVHDLATRYPNSPIGSRVWSQSADWMAGAMLEYQFRPQFSVEVDGMYRKLHMIWANVFSDGTLNSVSPSPVITWEFPVLAKYRVITGKLGPFVEAGPSFRTTGNLNFTPSHFGASAGIGVEAQWRGFRIAPLVRYTRWAPDLNTGGGGGGSQLNQVEMLIAFSHRAESNWNPSGRRVSLGAVLGWGLNPDLPSSTSSTTFPQQGVTMTQQSTGLTSSIAGPSLEIHVHPHLSVELDALHKPLRTRSNTTFENGVRPQSETWTEAATWQFPVLAKYRIRWGRVNPFIEAGPSFRLPQWSLSTHGVAAGTGVEMHTRALKVSPAVRFTHWGPDTGVGSGRVARNEASVVIGLSFGGTQLR